MALRYYPIAKIKTNLISSGEFVLDGKIYRGKYYETYDGQYFAGAHPAIGNNKRLVKLSNYSGYPGLNKISGEATKQDLINKTKAIGARLGVNEHQMSSEENRKRPTSYYPSPLQSDYDKGYFHRYFAKRVNDNGYIIEISEVEWSSIQNGTVPYDVSYWLTEKIFWKLTGPLNTIRLSQYDIRMGIVDNNKSKVETANKTFLGLVDFIGGKYDQYARSTS
jgi:hypothetical protein